MANLNGQNIGINYKGIINIGSTINQNVSASLQSLTDGDGNNLPIQVATGLVSIDGGTINFTTGTNTRSVLSHSYTINNTGGTNTVRGIFLNAIETSITGTTHNLMDLQVGGVSRVRVNSLNGFYAASSSVSHIIASFFGTINNMTFSIADNNSAFTLSAGSASTTVRLFGRFLIGDATTLASARLHVRGDGTNPIARFENNSGVARMIISDNGRVNMANLPTSSAGLSAGDLWNNGGVLNIV